MILKNLHIFKANYIIIIIYNEFYKIAKFQYLHILIYQIIPKTFEKSKNIKPKK